MSPEELMELFGNMPEQPEQKIGPIPEPSIDKDMIMDLVMGSVGGGQAKGARNILGSIIRRNKASVEKLKNLFKPKAHDNINKLLEHQKLKDVDFDKLLSKLNPDTRKVGNVWKLPDAKSATPQLNPPSKRPENLLGAMMLMLASPLIGKNLVDVGYGKLEGEPPNIGLPPKQR